MRPGERFELRCPWSDDPSLPEHAVVGFLPDPLPPVETMATDGIKVRCAFCGHYPVVRYQPEVATASVVEPKARRLWFPKGRP